jgi:hypothetical protein
VRVHLNHSNASHLDTPLFLARKVGNEVGVGLLERSGALLHVEEVEWLEKDGR